VDCNPWALSQKLMSVNDLDISGRDLFFTVCCRDITSNTKNHNIALLRDEVQSPEFSEHPSHRH
jgi:hypothetical protein